MTLRRADGLRRKTEAEISAGDRARATHTGTQAIATVDGLGTALDDLDTAAAAAATAAAAANTLAGTKASAAALGVSADADNLGAFASPAIPDNATTKAAIEGLASSLDGDSGGTYVQAKLSGTGSTKRTIVQILEDYSNSVLGYGGKGNGTDSDNTGIANALAKYDEIFLPPTAGGYVITGSGVTVGSGKTIRGHGSYEVGTEDAIDGTIIKMDPAATRAFSLLKGGDATVDSVTFKDFALNGENNDFAFYGDKIRQCVFDNLRFSNFKKCCYLDQDSWMNRWRNIKAFTFDRFVEGNSAFEDSSFEQVIARGYRAGSQGVVANFFSQTMYFEQVDLSEMELPLLVLLGSGNSTITADSCYFEMDTQSTRGAITIAAGSGSNVVLDIRGSRWFNKSGGALTDATAFEVSGSGKVEIICDGGKFDLMNRIVEDVSGSTLARISGRGNMIAGSSPVIYTGVGNAARQLQFLGQANAYNLESIDGLYTVTNNFGAGGTYDLTFPDGTGTGVYSIIFTNVGIPTGRAEYHFQPKGGFGNGIITELQDDGGNLSASVSGNTVTWTATAAANAQITVRKIA